jgi:hypothetical protein
VPDCDALKARYPDARVCELDGRLGEGEPNDDPLPTVTAADLEGCEILDGVLHVVDAQDSSLSALAGLKGVCGTLFISDDADLTSVGGLSDLTHVVGAFTLQGLDGLTNLSGLSRLEEVGELDLTDLPAEDLASLGSLARVSRLRLALLERVTSLQGLGALEGVDALMLSELASLTSLTGLDTLHTIHRSVSIDACAQLTSLASLDGVMTQGMHLAFSKLPEVTTLPALVLEPMDPAATATGSVHDVWLADLPRVTSWAMPTLAGQIGALSIERTGFVALDMVPSSWSISWQLMLSENPYLEDVSALDGLERADHVLIHGNPRLDNCALEAQLASVAPDAETMSVFDNGGEGACSP